MLQYRHEWKHRLSAADMIVLRQRLSAFMQPDPHAKGGRYFIRSLYFDTPEDTALREKLDGINQREKFRIRFYDFDTSVIHLEKKSKSNGLGTKQSAVLTAEQAQKIVDGEIDWMLTDPQPLIRELYSKMVTQRLQPKTIVDYVREPFVFSPGNVRVTLDYNICTGLSYTQLLDPNCPTVPIADDPILLEVKWDQFLPDLVRSAVQLEDRRAGSFSKYAACRMYD